MIKKIIKDKSWRCKKTNCRLNWIYNTKRLHSSLFYLTPNDYLNGTIKDKLEVRESKLAEARKNRILTRIAVWKST